MTLSNSHIEKFKQSIGKDTPMSLEANCSALLTFSTFNHDFARLIRKHYSFEWGPIMAVIDGAHTIAAFSRDSYRRTMQIGFDEYKKFGKEMKIAKSFTEAWHAADALIKEYPLDALHTRESAELRSILATSMEIGKTIFSSTIFSEMLDENAIRELYVETTGTNEGFATFLRFSASPTFESVALRIDQMLVSNPSLREAQLFFTDYFITPPLEEVAKRCELLVAQRGGVAAIQREIDQITAEVKANQEEVTTYRRTLSPQLQTLLDYVQLSMYTRDIRRLPLNEILTLASEITRELCRREGLAPEHAPYFFAEEVISGPISPMLGEEIKRRFKQGHAFFFDTDGMTIVYESIDEIRKELFALVDAHTAHEELKGSVAYHGVVRGMVQIIKSEKDFPLFKRGNILVTSMTRPEYVPLMKMASAIITDEGGVTCHAAIVSRELKLPCITGTRNATRVLHDGDLVEVDAEKGIVTILQRA